MNSLIHLRLSKLIITLFFIFTTGFLQAQTIAGPPNPVYSSSVPASISVQPNGADDVLMTTLRYNASAPLCFSQIQIILNSNNQALIDTQISDVNVYYDTNANDLFDSSVDALLDFGATNTFTDGVYTLSIPLNPAIISGTGWNRLFVAFDFANIIDSGSTVGCDIDSVTYGASGGPGTGGTNSPFSFTAVNSTGAIDDYRISDSYTDRAPATATQADSDVPIMNIDLDFTNASEISASADIDSITITRIGTSSVDADVTSVSLYNDNGTTAGEVDGGDTLLDTKTVAGGTATFDPVANITFAGDGAGSGLSLLVCMTLDANADANTTIGFSLVSPGNADPDLNGDLVFLDEFDDTLNQSSPAYVQKGIVTNTTSFSSSLIDILEYVEPDLTPPTLDSSIPASGATGVDNVSDIQVTFSETVTNVDGASVFTVSTGDYNSGTGTPIAGTVSPVTTDPGLSWTFTPDSNLSFSTVYYVELTMGVEDAASNTMAANAQFTFTTEAATPPSVVSTLPADSATDVSVSIAVTDITATFSESVNNVDGVSFTVEDQDTNPVSGTVSGSGTDYEFTPDSDLDYDTSYTATITTAVTDVDGTPMSADYSWSFSTAVRPALDSSIPASGASNVGIGADIQASFSEAVTNVDDADVFTVSTGDYNSGTGTPIAGTVNPVAADPGISWTFTPAADLGFATVYYVEITTAVADEGGVTLEANERFTFTTVASSPPEVASTYPVSNANNISLSADDTIISVTFNEPVSNVDASSLTLTDAESNTVSGTVTGNGVTFTLTLDEDLSYDTTYTASISTAVIDADSTPIATAYTWDFTTEAEYPSFSEPIVVNNTIKPGSSNPTLIFVPEPPAGPDSVMTVNVFTATGKRVITLVNKIPHSEVSSPIEWTGINGLGDRLGPGIYFVEIRAEDYRKTLKIRIVR